MDTFLLSDADQEEEKLWSRFSSLLDAKLQAEGAASDMLYAPKGSQSYKEAEEIFCSAIAFIKKFKKEIA